MVSNGGVRRHAVVMWSAASRCASRHALSGTQLVVALGRPTPAMLLLEPPTWEHETLHLLCAAEIGGPGTESEALGGRSRAHKVETFIAVVLFASHGCFRSRCAPAVARRAPARRTSLPRRASSRRYKKENACWYRSNLQMPNKYVVRLGRFHTDSVA